MFIVHTEHNFHNLSLNSLLAGNTNYFTTRKNNIFKKLTIFVNLEITADVFMKL